MALSNWLFLYSAPGLPAAGTIDTVRSDRCVTTLAGFPSTTDAIAACRGALAAEVRSAQLIELCGAFGSGDVEALRAVAPDTPIGLVTYTGDMVAGLHRLFG